MNGLPEDVDLRPLLGIALLQLCVGAHQLILNFEADVRLAVESTCVYSSADRARVEIEDFRRGASVLAQLIGGAVASAERAADGGLVLTFDDGTVLEIQNSNGPYESFQLHLGERTYVA